MSERARIERLQKIFSNERAQGVALGIGDDAAVLHPPPGPLVWTVDEQVEGSHFRLDWLSFEDVGYRATMAAASDLAAMGAVPLWALASLVLPKIFSEESFEAIARGQRAAVDALGASLVGGNLASGPCVSLATSWIGRAERPLGRAGARPGDGVYLCGAVGLAAAGLRSLQQGIGVADEALRAWRRPRALIAEGLRMTSVASACIDLSDGLAGDASHIARASGVGLVLFASALAAAAPGALFDSAAALGCDAMQLALHGGEDYALLCTSAVPIDGFSRVGEVIEGQGVVLREGAELRPLAGGFDHFA